jgi:hypothetical protein
MCNTYAFCWYTVILQIFDNILFSLLWCVGADLDPPTAIATAKRLRQIIDPIGTLPEFLNRLHRARVANGMYRAIEAARTIEELEESRAKESSSVPSSEGSAADNNTSSKSGGGGIVFKRRPDKL